MPWLPSLVSCACLSLEIQQCKKFLITSIIDRSTMQTVSVTPCMHSAYL